MTDDIYRDALLSDLVGLPAMTEEAGALVIERFEAKKAVPVFIYDGVRSKIASAMGEAVVKRRHEAETKGKLYRAPESDVLGDADFTAEGTIVGDLCWFKFFSGFSPITLRDLVQRARLVGHDVVVIEATYKRKTAKPRKKVVRALAFSGQILPRHVEIPTGDWESASARRDRA